MTEILNDFALGDLRTRTNTMRDAIFSDKNKYYPVPKDVIESQPKIIQQRPEYN
jgi:hypothetical protein